MAKFSVQYIHVLDGILVTASSMMRNGNEGNKCFHITGEKKRDDIFLHLKEVWTIREFFLPCIEGNNISFQRLGSNKWIYKMK